MAESTTKLVFEGEVGKAILGIAKVIEKMKEAKGTVKDFGKTSQETDKLSDSITGAANSAKNFIMGFASVGTVVSGVKALVNQMNEIVNLRKEFYEVGLTVEQLGIKIANLRGDVSEKGIKSAVTDINKIVQASGVPAAVAKNILFFSESGMGGQRPESMSGAMNIARFAGAAGLTDQEVRMIPKMFSAIGADTSEKQVKALNQLYTATRGSIAETGEFIEPFISPLISGQVRGFSYEQQLARMAAAVDVSGSVDEAATASAKIIEILSGKTEQAVKFYQKQAKKRGLDFNKMSFPERYEFNRQLFNDYSTSPEKLTELQTMIGGKGFDYVLRILSPTGQAKYEEALKQITAGGKQDVLTPMSVQYADTLSAKSSQAEAFKMMAGYQIGKQTQGSTLLEDVTEGALKRKHVNAGWWKSIGYALTPDSVEKMALRKDIIRQNLVLAYEQAGSEKEKNNLQNIYEEFLGTKSPIMAPGLMNKISDVTKSFQLQKITGRTINDELFTEENTRYIPGGGTNVYTDIRNRSLAEIANDDLKANTTATQENTKTMMEIIDANTKALNNLTDTLKYNSGGIAPTIKPEENN